MVTQHVECLLNLFNVFLPALPLRSSRRWCTWFSLTFHFKWGWGKESDWPRLSHVQWVKISTSASQASLQHSGHYTWLALRDSSRSWTPWGYFHMELFLHFGIQAGEIFGGGGERPAPLIPSQSWVSSLFAPVLLGIRQPKGAVAPLSGGEDVPS